MTEYITKEQALNAVNDSFNDAMTAKEFWDLLPQRMNAIPAADVAPVVYASWIDRTDDPSAGFWECGNCGEPWVLIEGTPEDNVMHYCPQCGARMDGDCNG